MRKTCLPVQQGYQGSSHTHTKMTGSLISFEHRNDASVDYIADVILCQEDWPDPRECVNGHQVPIEDGIPSFIVVDVEYSERKYSNIPLKVTRLTLMDGSETVFTGYLLASLTKVVAENQKPLFQGCTITVHSHKFLWWKKSSPDGRPRGIMLLQSYVYNLPPNYQVPKRHKRVPAPRFPENQKPLSTALAQDLQLIIWHSLD